MHPSEIRKIAFVGDYLPRKCGIATFTHDMCTSVAGRFPDAECFVVPVNDRPEGYDYPTEVRFQSSGWGDLYAKVVVDMAVPQNRTLEQEA